MLKTEAIEITDVEAVSANNTSVRAFIKVKTFDGSFKTIIPITNSASVLGTSGKSIDLEIAEIIDNLSSSDAAIEVLCRDTEALSGDMVSLADYVNPLMEQLKSHMEVVDLKDDVESGIFDHVYDELDTMASKISSIEQSISDITTKLNKVITDNANLTKTVNTLSSNMTTELNKVTTSNTNLSQTVIALSNKVSAHEDTIV